MKSAGLLSGCLVWMLLSTMLTICMCPVAAVVGSIASTAYSEQVAGWMEPYLCPANSRAEIITYETTSRDSQGFEQPATAYELQCVAADGTIVRPPGPEYGFYLVGVLMLAATMIAAVVSLLPAIPLAAWISRRRNRRPVGGAP
ncbi:MAG TPA: hypothetical protein PKA05_12540 [Roseiflexaceae bacterium]|nr:hypothetical protein [Roseiflexaceae bacterium]HMP41204.1 hypothetical protein [Roseiflexaceae bacterium]